MISTMIRKNMKNEKSGASSVVTAGIGAAVGAGVAVAAAVALNNPNTKEKMVNTFDALKNQALNKIPPLVHEGKKNVGMKRLGKDIKKRVNKKASKIKSATSNVNKSSTAAN